MTSAVVRKSGTQMARSPSVLVPLIKAALAEAERNQQEVANLFLEARDGFNSNAELYSWAHRHFDIGERQTDRYLSAGKHIRISRPVGRGSSLSLNEILRDAGQNRPTSGAVRRDWQPDVDAIAKRAKLDDDDVAEICAKVRAAHEAEAEES